MSSPRQSTRSVARLAVCALLLAWIFHTIFVYEGRLAFKNAGNDWLALSRWEQWQAAWRLGPAGLWHTLSLVHPGALFFSFLLMGSTVFLGMFRWRVILRAQGLDLSVDRTAEISLVAHFFNSFLLGSTGGDLMKAYYAARETKHKKAEAVTTVFVDRLIGLFAMLFFACLMMLPNLALLGAHRRLAAVAAVVSMMFVACLLLGLLAFWGGVSKSVPGARAWLRKLPKAESLERSLEACRHFGRHRLVLLKALGISMLLNAACVWQFIVLANGLGLKISAATLFLTVPAIISISALPVTPNGLGVREGLFVSMLAVPEIGVEGTQALSLSLLAYAGSLAWSLIGGLVYATLKERHQLREVAEG